MQLKLRSLSIGLVALSLLISLPGTAEAAQKKTTAKKPVVKKAVAKKTTVKKPVQKPDPKAVPYAGTWFLNDGDKPVKSTKIVFSKFGTFQFIGSGWKSEGKFLVKEKELVLEWTKVDNAPVKPGTMKKSFPMADDLAGFQIDKFKYRKQI